MDLPFQIKNGNRVERILVPKALAKTRIVTIFLAKL